jgi:hypothetical protein
VTPASAKKIGPRRKRKKKWIRRCLRGANWHPFRGAIRAPILTAKKCSLSTPKARAQPPLNPTSNFSSNSPPNTSCSGPSFVGALQALSRTLPKPCWCRWPCGAQWQGGLKPYRAAPRAGRDLISIGDDHRSPFHGQVGADRSLWGGLWAFKSTARSRLAGHPDDPPSIQTADNGF